MTDAARATLRNLLVNNCMSVSQRLARSLGASHPSDASSRDPAPLADHDKATAATSADGILRLALNIAADRRRADGRKLTPDEIDGLLQHAEEHAPMEADLSFQELQLALAELSGFTRAVFEAVLVDGATRCALAKRFGVTVSTIDAEVQRALEHGLQHLQQKNGAP